MDDESNPLELLRTAFAQNDRGRLECEAVEQKQTTQEQTEQDPAADEPLFFRLSRGFSDMGMAGFTKEKSEE